MPRKQARDVPRKRAGDVPTMLDVRLPRRSFLAASGLAALGTAAGGRILAAHLAPGRTVAQGPAQIVDDPIAALAAALDYDMERIFRYVADEVAYEPYAGSLRGPLGTLESGAGNSVDKASLLAALLSASLIETTFVEGRLDDEAAAALRAASDVDAATITERADSVLTGRTMGRGLSGAGSSTRAPAIDGLPGDARALVEATFADSGAVVARTEDLVDAGVGTILGALAARGIAIPASGDDLPVLERERHAWLRVPQGAAQVDLDATMPGSEVGRTIATPTATDLSALPDDLRHRVEIRVTVERIAGDALEQEVILEHLAFADELAGRPIVLSHEQPAGLKGLGVGLDQMLTGTVAYQPVLQVDDLLRVGLVGVALQGAEEDSLLGALGSGERDGEATAEWLQVAIVAPDGTRDVADRTLFDRIGPELRAAGPDTATIPPVELLPLAPGGPPEFAPVRAIHFLAVATGSTGPRVTQALEDDDESAWPLHVVGHLYHMARDGAASIVAAARGVRLFHDAPNVVRYSLENVPGATDGSFTTAMDILHRSFRTGPVVGRPAAVAPGVVAGVLSHVVERITMGVGDPRGGPVEEQAVSVGAILEAAADQGIGTTVVLAGDDAAALPFSSTARATLDAALAAGWVAIGPERGVVVGGAERVGWWLFDPTTGRVIDRLDDGRGIAMVENALARYAAFLASHPYIKLGLCIALTVKALHGLLEGMSGGNPGAFALATAGAAGALRRIACA